MAWYTLYCKPKKENQVNAYLQSKQVTTYYPTLKIKPNKPHASHLRGYFPRYVFIETDLSRVGENALRWIPGTVGLVEFGGEPAVVPETFIADLRRRIAAIEKAGGFGH